MINIKHEIIKKTLLYRILSISIGFFVPFLISGDLLFTLKVGFFTEFSTTLIYYLYERVWRIFVREKILEEGNNLLLTHDKNVQYELLEKIDDDKYIIKIV